MSQRSTFVESIVIKPLVGNCVRVESVSGDETLHFCMERSTAVAAAYAILREAEAFDMAELGADVVPIRRAG